VVEPGADLARYRLVVVPNLYLVSAAAAERLAAFVAAGGHVLISFFSGIVDERERLHAPAPWRELLGVAVEEPWPLAEGEQVEVRDGERTYLADTWSEDLVLDGAEALATFASGPLSGGAAVTRHAFGSGVATYVATRPEAAAMAAIVQETAEAAGVRPVLDGLPTGVEATRRGNHLFLLNHNDTAVRVRLPDGSTDLLGGDGELAPLGVAVLRLQRED
jgi:beta-galactosidase